MAPQEENPEKPRKRVKAKKDKPSRKPKSPKKSEGRKKAPKAQKPTATEKAWEETKRFLLYYFRQHWLLICVTVCIATLLTALYYAGDVLDGQRTPTVTDKVTFKFAINGTDIGAVELGLFGTTCPMTTKNFIMLATHEKGYGYKGSNIYSIIPMHLFLGGDITHGNGTGGRSALDTPFENENFKVQHAGPGYLGMLALDNNRDSHRTSIFYITINAMQRLDKNSVAFGKVLNGMEVVKRIEATEIDDKFIPYGNVTITDTWHEAA